MLNGEELSVDVDDRRDETNVLEVDENVDELDLVAVVSGTRPAAAVVVLVTGLAVVSGCLTAPAKTTFPAIGLGRLPELDTIATDVELVRSEDDDWVVAASVKGTLPV